MKTCSKCNKRKPLIQFVRNKQCKHGYSGTCKECKNKYSKEWKRKHRKRTIKSSARIGKDLLSRVAIWLMQDSNMGWYFCGEDKRIIRCLIKIERS